MTVAMAEEGGSPRHSPLAKLSHGLEASGRRFPTQGAYKTELCNKFETIGACPYGDACQFAHGLEELRPVIRPPSWKTKPCEWLASGRECPYGRRCHFKHPADEMFPPSSLHVRAKSWDATSLPPSPGKLGSSNLGKYAAAAWDSPPPRQPQFTKSLSSERDKYANDWAGQAAAHSPRRMGGSGASPFVDGGLLADLSPRLSRLCLSPSGAESVQLHIPQPLPASGSEASDSPHSASPSKAQLFPPHLAASLGSPRKAHSPRALDYGSPRTILACRTSLDGSPRALDIPRPLLPDPGSPRSSSPYARSALGGGEGLSPSHAQAELQEAWQRVQAGGSAYPERTAQLQLLLDTLTRRGLQGTGLHVQVLETLAREAVQQGDWPRFAQWRAALTQLPPELWACDELTGYLLLHAYLTGTLPASKLATLEDRVPVGGPSPLAHALAVCRAVAAGDFVRFFQLREAAPHLNGVIMDSVADEMRAAGVQELARLDAQAALGGEAGADVLGEWRQAHGGGATGAAL